MKTVIQTKFGHVVQDEIPAGVSLRNTDRFPLAMIVKDKKAFDAHISKGGSRDDWNTVYAIVVPTEINEDGFPCWKFLNDIDLNDDIKKSEYEEKGNIVRGFLDVNTAINYTVEKLEQLLCPKEIA